MPRAATAPRVAHHRGASMPLSPSAWSSSRVPVRPASSVRRPGWGPSARASSDRTPVRSPNSGSSRASSARSTAAPTRVTTTSAPWPARACSQASAVSSAPGPSGVTSSQRPERRGSAGAVSGSQAMR